MPNKEIRILVVAATESELQKLDLKGFADLSIDSLVTGIGMVATAHSLTEKLVSEKFNLVVNIGITGSFNRRMKIGQVVQVNSDRLIELGAEDGDRFVPADEMGWVEFDQLEFVSPIELKGLVNANGITVNRVHGNAESIRKTVEEFNPDVESMEGAAVAYVCRQMDIPWVQIRSISNRVEPRNKDNWDIPLALKNLNGEVQEQLKWLGNEA